MAHVRLEIGEKRSAGEARLIEGTWAIAWHLKDLQIFVGHYRSSAQRPNAAGSSAAKVYGSAAHPAYMLICQRRMSWLLDECMTQRQIGIRRVVAIAQRGNPMLTGRR